MKHGTCNVCKGTGTVLLAYDVHGDVMGDCKGCNGDGCTYICDQCGDPFLLHGVRNEYGIIAHIPLHHRGKQRWICCKCCKANTESSMRADPRITLYLVYKSACNNPQFTTSGINLTPSEYRVSDWPGLISFTPTRVSVGKHNMCGRRWDVWFHFEGYVMHGVAYNTQLLHCRKTKRKVG